MNKTKIEWCDYSWNPVTGCWGPGGTAEKPNWCFYCYARKMARRIQAMNEAQMESHEKINQAFRQFFRPEFHPLRLKQPSRVIKPSKIFVCSMADLFGDWVPEAWIRSVLVSVRKSPRHTFQFLTKNPKRLKDFNPWPPNCWVGTTVTNQEDADERVPWLNRADASIKFISHEPLISQIDNGLIFYPVHWAIIGAMTGPGAVKPQTEWVQILIDQYRAAGVPVFLKDNLRWPEKIQEFPR